MLDSSYYRKLVSTAYMQVFPKREQDYGPRNACTELYSVERGHLGAVLLPRQLLSEEC